MPIRQLAPDVAAKIAAGEVVERPASVVKELIENSIDAGATQIRVDLMNGGLQLIRVTDNGQGIAASELALALSRHATSKVTRIDDLEHIRSLGFRGEALASIAAVADVTLISHARGAHEAAQVQALNGQISEVTMAGVPEGTTLTVRNLFGAVPARLKFLKSRNTEVSHCHHLLEQYALAYPEIRFSVFSEGRQIFATPGDGQLTSTLIEIYGLQVAEQMVPISSLDGNDDDPERPVVTGYTSLPACYKSTRHHLSFFVNRRWVMSRMLSYAVEEAYHSLLLPGRHPVAVVNIALDPGQIDVNVHPAKTEIRFLKERRVYAAILRAVRSAVIEDASVPRWQGGSSQSAALPDIPVTPDLPLTAAETSIVDDDIMSSPPTPEQNTAATGPALPHDNPWLTVTEEETGTKPPLLSRLWQSHVRSFELDGDAAPPKTHHNEPVGSWSESAVRTPQEQRADSRQTHTLAAPDASSATSVGTTQKALPLVSGRLPRLRVIGQLSRSYIVTEGEDGLFLIDQHAAHERILLERMVAALQARQSLSQLLLTPLQLALAPAELAAIEEQQSHLERIGFSLELQERGILVRAVPEALIKQMNARSLQELLAELTMTEQAGHGETWEEHALANVACKAAIKANYYLTTSEMSEMLEQLGRTQAPYSCCHGRPTMVHFGLSMLEREFGRR